METPYVQLEELRWRQFSELDKDRTVFFIVLGPVEEHGPQLPLSTDILTARSIARLMVDKLRSGGKEGWTFVLSPDLTVGADTLQKPGSIEIRQRVVRDILVDYGRSLVKWGARWIVVCNFHGGMGHNSAIEEACRRMNRSRVARRNGAIMFHPVINQGERLFRGEFHRRIEEKLGRPLSEEEKSGMPFDTHGGFWETGAVLWQRPDLVDPDYRKLTPFTSGFLSAGTYFFGRRAGEGPGYFGLPHLADAAIGRAVIEIVADEAAALTDGILDGRDLPGRCTNTFYKMGIFHTRLRPLRPVIVLLYNLLESMGLWRKLDEKGWPRHLGTPVAGRAKQG